MISAMFRTIGRLALWLASMAFLTGVSLFVIGSFLLTWPLLRLSPRDKRIRAGVDFASSAMTLLTTFSDRSVEAMLTQSEPEEDTDEEPDEESPTSTEWLAGYRSALADMNVVAEDHGLYIDPYPPEPRDD